MGATVSLALAVDKYRACGGCSTEGVIVWHFNECPQGWVKPRRRAPRPRTHVASTTREVTMRKVPDVQVFAPDTLTLEEYRRLRGAA
jgi:hypothetical protein